MSAAVAAIAVAALLALLPGAPAARVCGRAGKPRACTDADPNADHMLVRATEALRMGDLHESQRLLNAARGAYAEGSERLALLDIIQSRIDVAAPREGFSTEREAHPLSSAEVQAAARKAASKAVAARLAAKSGPVAWSPIPDLPEQEAAMRAGDAALSRTVAALGAKEFVEAYEVRCMLIPLLPSSALHLGRRTRALVLRR